MKGRANQRGKANEIDPIHGFLIRGSPVQVLYVGFVVRGQNSRRRPLDALAGGNCGQKSQIPLQWGKNCLAISKIEKSDDRFPRNLKKLELSKRKAGVRLNWATLGSPDPCRSKKHNKQYLGAEVPNKVVRHREQK